MATTRHTHAVARDTHQGMIPASACCTSAGASPSTRNTRHASTKLAWMTGGRGGMRREEEEGREGGGGAMVSSGREAAEDRPGEDWGLGVGG